MAEHGKAPHRTARTASGAVLVLLGLALALLPEDWIERSLGFEPDADSGAVEVLLVLVPLVIGALLLAPALVDRVRHAARSER